MKDALEESESEVLVQRINRSQLIFIHYYTNAVIYRKHGYYFTSLQCTSKSINREFVILTSKLSQSNCIFILEIHCVIRL